MFYNGCQPARATIECDVVIDGRVCEIGILYVLAVCAVMFENCGYISTNFATSMPKEGRQGVKFTAYYSSEQLTTDFVGW